MLFFVRHWKLLLGLLSVFFVAIFLQKEIQQARIMIELQNKTEQQQEYINTRKRIDDAGENVRGVDPDAALEWLRNRQDSR